MLKASRGGKGGGTVNFAQEAADMRRDSVLRIYGGSLLAAGSLVAADALLAAHGRDARYI